MKKSLSALVLAGSLTFAGSAAAVAAPGDYPPTPPGAQVSNGVVTINQTFVLSGSGFRPFERIVITITVNPRGAGGGPGTVTAGRAVGLPIPAAPQALAAQADANGTFSLPLTIDTPGAITLTAVGAESGNTVTSAVTVSAPTAAAASNVQPAASAGGLANTGVDASVLFWSLVGVGAVAAGGSTVFVVRRRYHATADA